MKKQRLLWILWFIILILSAYVIPYCFIGDSGKMTGSFLYWTLFALAAIISTFKITSQWKD